MSAEIIKAAEDGKICILVSEEIVEEIRRTLTYPRLRKVYEQTGITRTELMEAVLKLGKFVEVTTEVNIVVDDPADNKFIECALAGKADCVVSGDKHLKLKNYQKIKILPVIEFVTSLQSRKIDNKEFT